MPKCKRCGQCCFFQGKPCNFLFIKYGKAECLIYEYRFDKKHDQGRGHNCIDRIKTGKIHKGCPYNAVARRNK